MRCVSTRREDFFMRLEVPAPAWLGLTRCCAAKSRRTTAIRTDLVKMEDVVFQALKHKLTRVRRPRRIFILLNRRCEPARREGHIHRPDSVEVGAPISDLRAIWGPRWAGPTHTGRDETGA